jgi:hypothetical protein
MAVVTPDESIVVAASLSSSSARLAWLDVLVRPRHRERCTKRWVAVTQIRSFPRPDAMLAKAQKFGWTMLAGIVLAGGFVS